MEDPSTETLRKLAPCWTLAGDEALLTILQNTHQRLLAKCQETNAKLEGMATALEDASISLQNVNNKFMALSSSQFIESRVYDDDVDVAMDTPAPKESPKPSIPDELAVLKRSMAVLESTHELITILQDSDTDSDTDDQMPDRVVMKPKDLYADRPLPYIIGSEPWKNKWHAGLVVEDSDTDSSTSKVHHDSDQYSASETEDMMPEPQRVARLSETSSELPSELETKPTPSDVASEIARRLGAGVPPPKTEEPEEYDEPSKPAVRKIYKPQEPVPSQIFSDEPPPLNTDSDSSDDIFAELHRQPHATHATHATHVAEQLFQQSDSEGDIFNDFKQPPPATKPTSLFEAGPKPNVFVKTAEPARNQTQDSEQPPKTTENDDRSVKKPVGGISLFGSSKGADSIGAAILNRNRRKSSPSDDTDNDVTSSKPNKDIFEDLFTKNKPKEKAKNDEIVVKDKPKVVDLFSDNLFDDIDDLFTTVVAKKEKKTVFEDDDDLFSEIAEPKSVKSAAKDSSDVKKGLFDSDDDLFADSITNVKPSVSKPVVTKVENVTKPESIVTKPEASNVTKTEISKVTKSIFDDDEDDIVTKPVEKVTKTPETTKICNTNSIFDDDEDIFSNTKTNTRIQNTGNTNVFKSPSLFDEDDDDSDLFSEAIKSTKPIKKDTAKESEAIKTVEPTKNVTAKEDKPIVTEKIINNDTVSSKIEASITDVKPSSVKTDDVTGKSKISPEMIKKDDFIQNNDFEESSESNNSDIFNSQENNLNINTKTTSIHKIFEKEDLPIKEEKSHQNSSSNSEVKTKITHIFEDDTLEDDIFSSKNMSGNKPITNQKPDLKAKPEIQPKQKEENLDKPKFEAKNLDSNIDIGENAKIETKLGLNLDKPENIITIDPEIPNLDSNIPSDTKTDQNPGKTDEISKNIPIPTETPIQVSIENLDIQVPENPGIFSAIVTEPPAFEKPKEPKKSKNVNALFDDDSDDEALFFKKNDLDEIPENFSSKPEIFNIFTDVPPDDLSDDLFMNLPQPKLPGNDEVPGFGLKASQDDLPVSDIPGFSETLKTVQVPNDNMPVFSSPLFDAIINFESESNTKLPEFDKSKEIEKKNIVEDLLKNDNVPEYYEIPKDLDSIPVTKDVSPVSDKISNITEVLKDDLPVPTVPGLSKTEPVKNTEIPVKHDTVLNKTQDSEIENKETNLFKNNDIFKSSDKNLDFSDDEELFKSLPVHINQAETLKNLDLDYKSDEENYKSLPIFENNVKPSSFKSIEKIDSKSEKTEIKKVGKLKLGLNINVNALLPGASPKKIKTQLSPDSPDGQSYSSDAKIDSKSVGFDKKPESEILDNKLSKERPRIQVKRRPSTRKARREAVRKSGIDFGDDSTDNSSSIDDPPKTQVQEIQVNDPQATEIQAEIVKNTIDRQEIEAKVSPKDTPIQDEIQASYPVKTPVKSDSTTKIVYILNDEDIFNTSAIESPDLAKSEDKNLDFVTNAAKNADVPASVAKDIDTVGNTDENVAKNLGIATNVTKNPDLPTNVAKKLDVTANIAQNVDSKVATGNPDPNLGIKTLGKTYKSEKSIFGEENSDEELFKNTKTMTKSSIFDSDSEGELFGNKKVKSGLNVDSGQKGKSGHKVESGQRTKMSLFDDDDDDLFAVAAKKTVDPQPSRSTPSAKETPKSTQPVFEDPLSMFGDDD
ncbi:family with sequence similarity 21 [Anticarsia gemmatalis]|uniref:family with sequence similarity 21 n=1 Tax=Anticarsia gemmatalis TaxID=129554 RepID=UPI003F76D893